MGEKGLARMVGWGRQWKTEAIKPDISEGDSATEEIQADHGIDFTGGRKNDEERTL